jgi:hypothetical protein
MKRISYWTLFAVTMALYATILMWSLPIITAEAGGLAPFDLRPGGYSLADAQAFLSALSPAGAAFYRGTQHLLDLFYPPLMSLTLFFAIAALLPRRWGKWRWLLSAPALAIAVFDVGENIMVDRMLEASANGLTADLVATASGFTLAKSALSTVVMSALLVLLVVRISAWAMARFKRSAQAT